MELAQSQIEAINKKCPENQGIFKEPYGIPVHIKEQVIYSRYEIGGVHGGNCHDESVNESYVVPPPKDRMKVLEFALKELRPQISFLEYRMIEGLIHDNEETEYEYYGNSTDWKIEYIKLSDLYGALAKLG